ncbi:MAG: EamA family transporter [Colwellia sp.]|nr:EamA family transporter [Colwellia sp.]
MKSIHLLIALAVVIVWGLNFSIIKLGVSEMEPLILTGLRFLFAAIPAILFIPRPKVAWSILATYGILFGVGVWGMLTLSIHVGMSAGMASLLLQSSVFINVLLGTVFLRESLSIAKITGLLLSIIGLILIFTITDGSVTALGMILALVAAVSLSLTTLIIKTKPISEMFAFVVWSCIFAPLPLFLISYLLQGSQGFILLRQDISFLGLFSVMFQAYPVTLLGYFLWNKLTVLYPMSTMAPLTLLVPIFGFLASILFYQEPIGLTKVIAFSLIIIGLFINLADKSLMTFFTKAIAPNQ